MTLNSILGQILYFEQIAYPTEQCVLRINTALDGPQDTSWWVNVDADVSRNLRKYWTNEANSIQRYFWYWSIVFTSFSIIFMNKEIF